MKPRPSDIDRSAGISCVQPADRGCPVNNHTRDQPHHERSAFQFRLPQGRRRTP